MYKCIGLNINTVYISQASVTAYLNYFLRLDYRDLYLIKLVNVSKFKGNQKYHKHGY